ncbi:hypothetical protein HYU12_01365 [Candidatus Woesearchaeota archaeon]|nr:hypothetical protein [Candidatus Woesearchaeota archaeon]
MIAKGRILEWGNSFGLRLSKIDVADAGLHANQDVEVEITPKVTKVKDVFGTLKKKVNTAKALREIDRMFGEK